ncbi:MAG: site-specific integrase [Lachnospiraceae bacterium]|nr:site-specific integrase [Lachnospiraceae bacterium]
MKLPNGYGSVYKLSGNRRKPWAVRLTVSHDEDYHMKYKYLGYYETQADALAALAAYHNDPHSLDNENITFADVYRLWSNEHFPKIRQKTQEGYRTSYLHCAPIHNLPMVDIKRAHLQNLIDTCGKNIGTLKLMKTLMTTLFKFALQNDIVVKNYAQFVDVNQYKEKNPNANPHTVFTSDEINDLWERSDDDIIKTVLMLIYSGCRISELLELKKDNVNIAEHYFDIINSKTNAGIRRVPIADKIMPFFSYFMEKGDKYLLGKHIIYRTYLDHWDMVNTGHTPHDTRHTCVSLLTTQGVDERIIRKIVGHSGKSITESVYTHIDMDKMLEAINLI